MLKIGLTGGIGCGKSSVADLFEKQRIVIIDADEIAHSLVKPGKPALQLIEKQFGSHIITEKGHIKRAVLRDIIFSQPKQKKQLEAILHPLVYAQIQLQIEALDQAYCIISIPLLLETEMEHLVDRILVIDCPIEHQISRVKKRDRLTEQRIRSIISTQVPREQRLSAADDIIDNTNTIEQLAEQVKKLHNLYLTLSKKF